jgi:hypothetical protein
VRSQEGWNAVAQQAGSQLFSVTSFALHPTVFLGTGLIGKAAVEEHRCGHSQPVILSADPEIALCASDRYVLTTNEVRFHSEPLANVLINEARFHPESLALRSNK